MDSTVDPKNEQQLHKLMRDLGQFIAMYEQADDHLKIRKEELDNQLRAFKDSIQIELASIKGTVGELSEVMTAAGAARWRISAEKALKQGNDHLTTMRDLCDTYKKLAEESVEHLDHVALSTEKRITTAMKHLSNDNFAVVSAYKERTQIACEAIEAASKGTIKSIRGLLRWLRLERIATALVAGLVSALVVSIYVNAESPIASHNRSVQERLIGKRIMTVWPTLTEAKQEEVNQLLGTDIQ